MSRPTVVVAGLGPAGEEMLPAQTLAAAERIHHQFLRTRQHPAAASLASAVSCDDLYDAGEAFEDVYRAITERLVEAAIEHGTVLYAVPGSPLVLERSVEYLRQDDRVEVTFIASMSFLDLVWARLGIDPVEVGVRLVDGHTFAVSAAGERGPMLVAHCHNQRVLSDIKLSVDEPGDALVTVLQRLGTVDEAVFTVAWADLDREVDADHLTSLYIPKLGAPVAAELMAFHELVDTLRRECPWDREQTHQTLRRHLVEEAYELVDAIDGFDAESGAGADHLEEELGDLMFQVFLHSVIAAEAGWFDLADVARAVRTKLHDRHPHVFAGAEVSGTDELVRNWEAAKLAEKGRASVMDGVASHLPALSLAEKALKKSAAIGLEPSDVGVTAVAETLDEFQREPSDETLGAVLIALVAQSRQAGLDPEMALRGVTRQLMDRVRDLEPPGISAM